MQSAERWFGIGSIVVALAGTGALAVQLRPHHHPHFHHFSHHHHIQFERTNCVGAAAQPAPDPMISVFDQAHAERCLTSSKRIEMLIEIGADGRVTNATHRPEQPTAESRCIAKAVSGLRFPAMSSPLAVRKVFSR